MDCCVCGLPDAYTVFFTVTELHAHGHTDGTLCDPDAYRCPNAARDLDTRFDPDIHAIAQRHADALRDPDEYADPIPYAPA